MKILVGQRHFRERQGASRRQIWQTTGTGDLPLTWLITAHFSEIWHVPEPVQLAFLDVGYAGEKSC